MISGGSDVRGSIREMFDAVAAAIAARATEEVVTKVRETSGEPYVLADILCNLYHSFDVGTLTGFATDNGFVVSCVDCKRNASRVVDSLAVTFTEAVKA